MVMSDRESTMIIESGRCVVRIALSLPHVFHNKEMAMKRAALFFVATFAGLAFAGPIQAETVKLQIKGAY